MMNQSFGFPTRGNRMPCNRGNGGPSPSPSRHSDGGCMNNGRMNGGHPHAHSGGGCGCCMNRPRAVAVESRNNGCGCGCENKACKQLLDQIRAVDFALWETILYLDVYPHSCDALETYHKLKAQSEALRREYEAACGPLTATGNLSTTSWDWVSTPFPWEYDAD